jgi:hypothetical protein
MKIVLTAALMLVATTCFAEEKHEQEGPCKEIKEACEKAGFVKGEAKQGTGLWVDCIDPIMQGVAQPASAKKPLPKVNPALVTACKEKHPNFGQGHPKKDEKKEDKK